MNSTNILNLNMPQAPAYSLPAPLLKKNIIPTNNFQLDDPRDECVTITLYDEQGNEKASWTTNYSQDPNSVTIQGNLWQRK